jgi:hypothetical protein
MRYKNTERRPIRTSGGGRSCGTPCNAGKTNKLNAKGYKKKQKKIAKAIELCHPLSGNESIGARCSISHVYGFLLTEDWHRIRPAVTASVESRLKRSAFCLQPRILTPNLLCPTKGEGGITRQFRGNQRTAAESFVLFCAPPEE